MNYFVILIRYHFNQDEVEDHVCLFDREEAIGRNWIDGNGNRIWAAPANNEQMAVTFVWGFDTLQDACAFFDMLKAEKGMKVKTN